MRSALAIDFAHAETDDDFARTCGDLGRHLRLVSYKTAGPVIDQQPPCLASAWALAAINTAYAAMVLWHALQLTARRAPEFCRRMLLRVSRPLPLLGLCGWVYAISLTALLFWR